MFAFDREEIYFFRKEYAILTWGVTCILVFLMTWIAVVILQDSLAYFIKHVVRREADSELIMATVFVTAIVVLPLWNWVARRSSKRWAYIAGMGFWAVVLCSAIFIQPAQVGFIMILAVLSGLGASTAHVLPDAIFPDVIEWDELRTRKRHEGVYYGIKNFARKLAGAVSIFVVLQVLGWFGYQAPPEG